MAWISQQKYVPFRIKDAATRSSFGRDHSWKEWHSATLGQEARPEPVRV